MRKKKRTDIHWSKSHFYHICCDCGLRHHVIVDREVSRQGKNYTLVENDHWLAMRWFRDDTSTDRRRKQGRIEVRVRGKKIS